MWRVGVDGGLAPLWTASEPCVGLDGPCRWWQLPKKPKVHVAALGDSPVAAVPVPGVQTCLVAWSGALRTRGLERSARGDEGAFSSVRGREGGRKCFDEVRGEVPTVTSPRPRPVPPFSVSSEGPSLTWAGSTARPAQPHTVVVSRCSDVLDPGHLRTHVAAWPGWPGLSVCTALSAVWVWRLRFSV